ncbi:hypothetical protein FIM08_03855 [SAR202 cluster bacterium AC-647-N09_OGT_505m]|nr:hypothetical protein [SAR202 cluster bacterium AC-647-N09_OGT_505m]
MRTRVYLGALVGITIVLVMTSAIATAAMGPDSDSEPSKAENVTNHHSTGNWQTVLMEDGTKCEGLVFETIEGAEQAALEIGCSGHHEHLKEDGTVLYMPCALGDIQAEILDALARGDITQEQVDEKLAWIEAKNLE